MESQQCRGVTKQGTRCTRRCANPPYYCYQHRPAPPAERELEQITERVEQMRVRSRSPSPVPAITGPIVAGRLSRSGSPPVPRSLSPTRSGSPGAGPSNRGRSPSPIRRSLSGSRSRSPQRKSSPTECCICMDELTAEEKLYCGHALCRECVGGLRKSQCPVCRRPLEGGRISPTSLSMITIRELEDADRQELQNAMSAFGAQLGYSEDDIYQISIGNRQLRPEHMGLFYQNYRF